MRFRSLQFPPDPSSPVGGVAKQVLGDLPDNVVVVFDPDDDWRLQINGPGGFHKDCRIAPDSRTNEALEALLRGWREEYVSTHPLSSNA
jgi:hypothetical protein